MYTIKISFEQPGLTDIILKKAESGYSLLETVLSNNIELSHKCGGICSCSTCHIYLQKGAEFINETSIREHDFIRHALNPKPNSRLACQCLLSEGSGAIELSIPHAEIFPDK